MSKANDMLANPSSGDEALGTVLSLWIDAQNLYTVRDPLIKEYIKKRDDTAISGLLKEVGKMEEDISLYIDFVNVHSKYSPDNVIEVNVTQVLKMEPKETTEKQTETELEKGEPISRSTQTELAEGVSSEQHYSYKPNDSSKEYIDLMDKNCGTDQPIATYKNVGIMADMPHPLQAKYNDILIEYQKQQAEVWLPLT
jgi:hypothetical protein